MTGSLLKFWKEEKMRKFKLSQSEVSNLKKFREYLLTLSYDKFTISKDPSCELIYTDLIIREMKNCFNTEDPDVDFLLIEGQDNDIDFPNWEFLFGSLNSDSDKTVTSLVGRIDALLDGIRFS